jgi:putative transposase
LHAITPGVSDRLIALRRSRPSWGPHQLLARLTMDDSETDWPAPDTVGDLLRRHDLSKPRRRQGAGSKPALTQPEAANESWAIDFKGWLRTGDGVRCEPLTVTDGYSHCLMVC